MTHLPRAGTASNPCLELLVATKWFLACGSYLFDPSSFQQWSLPLAQQAGPLRQMARNSSQVSSWGNSFVTPQISTPPEEKRLQNGIYFVETPLVFEEEGAYVSWKKVFKIFKDFKCIKIINSMDWLCLLFGRNQDVSCFWSIFLESGRKWEAALPSSILILELQKKEELRYQSAIFILLCQYTSNDRKRTYWSPGQAFFRFN